MWQPINGGQMQADQSVQVTVYFAEDRRSEKQSIEKKVLLASLQKLVDGYIEPLSIGDGKIAIVNEDGLPLGMPRNMTHGIAQYGFVGNVVVMNAADFE
jgi:hypothetical protein